MVMPGFFGQPQYPNLPRARRSPGAGGGFGGQDFTDFLEEEPRLAYFGQQQRFGRSPNQRRYFQDRFQQVFNKYLGQLGQQIEGGGQPNLQFTDFIQNFDFNQQFANLDPSARGFFPSRIAPRTRFLFY